MKIRSSILLIGCLLVACSDPTLISENKRLILSPLPGFEYQESTQILFISELIPGELKWTSSIDGELGYGDAFFRCLSAGEHAISLYDSDKILDKIIINVTPENDLNKKSIKRVIYKEENFLSLSEGIYHPVIYSTGHANMRVELYTNLASGSIANKKTLNEKFLQQKTYRANGYSNSRKNIFMQTKKNMNREISYDPVGNRRTFIVANTANLGSTGYNVNAVLWDSSPSINLWIDEDSKKDEITLQSLWDEMNSIGFPRVKALWGDWEDLNNNGKVDVLITPRINNDLVAIGFFNPADFYAYNNDENSSEFNILSNEMDIIYLADPCETSDVFAYSKDSILATFCHEMTHLINFSRKIYRPLINGNPNINHEEIYLDEGLAHLTESLCGYGESGGNLAFFSRYLNNPSIYSLNGYDVDGSIDSVGKRGGVSAFLSWLFWKQGGAQWSTTTSGEIIDSGGIAFLQRLLDTNLIGWENLSYALQDSADSLFMEWVVSLHQSDGEINKIIYDPITNQPLNIVPYYGILEINGNLYPILGPNELPINQSVKLLPYSAVWFEEITSLGSKEITIFGEENKGLVIAEFVAM